MRYLSEPGRAIGESADLLGFWEQSVFCRAFKTDGVECADRVPAKIVFNGFPSSTVLISRSLTRKLGRGETMVAEMAHIFLTDIKDLPAHEGQESQDYLTMLVGRVLAGDSLAFERIMLATEQRVVSIAWRMLGNQDDARDAAQEVYLRVFKYLPRFRAGEDFRAWLYRITINVCHDLVRKKSNLPLTSFEADDYLPGPGSVDAGTDLEMQALHSQRLELVRQALHSLPAKERAALVLRDLEGWSTEEVARTLGSRAVTVRTQVSSARAKLKSYFEKLTRRRESR